MVARPSWHCRSVKLVVVTPRVRLLAESDIHVKEGSEVGWPGLHTTHFPVLCCKGQHELRGIQYGGAAALHHVAARHAGGSGYTRPELRHSVIKLVPVRLM